MSFVGPAFNWYTASVLAMMYAISCYTGPRYNDIRLHCGYEWLRARDARSVKGEDLEPNISVPFKQKHILWCQMLIVSQLSNTPKVQIWHPISAPVGSGYDTETLSTKHICISSTFYQSQWRNIPSTDVDSKRISPIAWSSGKGNYVIPHDYFLIIQISIN